MLYLELKDNVIKMQNFNKQESEFYYLINYINIH